MDDPRRSAQQHSGCRSHGVTITTRSATRPRTAHASATANPSAAVEPGPILQASPPRSRRRPASRTLDRTHPLIEPTQTPEADTDLGVRAQTNHWGVSWRVAFDCLSIRGCSIRSAASSASRTHRARMAIGVASSTSGAPTSSARCVTGSLPGQRRRSNPEIPWFDEK